MIPKSLRNRMTLGAALLVACGVAWSIACSSEQPGGIDTGNGIVPPPGGDACGHPNPGCACSTAGAVADCGKVESRVGNYVTCAMGKTTCDGTTWGQCIGDVITTKGMGGAVSGGGLRFASLGASSACGSANACDPYCNNFVDTPSGIDAAGISSSDAGLSIAPDAGGLCYCNEPSGGSTSLYGNLTAAYKGNPASCVGANTASDNCQHDYYCNHPDGGAATCVPYSAAQVNSGCTSTPDYTVGVGCYDGSGWELEVCNRGLVPSQGTGTLVIGLSSSSPTGVAGTCSSTIGPQIGATGTTVGHCNIDLTTTSIGPGQCINLNTSSCVAQSGGAISLGTNFWAYVNPPTGVLAGAAPVAECDVCNNYSAINDGSKPPALAGGAACNNQICGTVCSNFDGGAGGDGGGCHTYVSGTVYDPGGNIPLPGIAVYQPKAGLAPFTAGVSCDSCQSVLPSPSNIESSTFSDINGQFNLEVTTLTGIPIVFQTGRWRRQITIGVDTPALTACQVNNITKPADCYAGATDAGTPTRPAAWPATNCKTRMPQVASEGDIPLIAFATGSAEPFECSFAQFMGGTQEFGIGGSTKRIQLYRSNGVASFNSSARSGVAAIVGAPPARATGKGWISSAAVGSSATVQSLCTTYKNGTSETIGAASGTAPYPVSVTNLSPTLALGAYPGGWFTVWGSKSGTNPTNNGNYVIQSEPSASSITYNHQGGVVDGYNGNSKLKWGACSAAGPLTASFVGGTLTLAGGSDSVNNVTSPITAVNSTSSVTVTNAAATADQNNGQSGLTWTAVAAPGYVVISGLSGISVTDVGNSITLSGGAFAGNRGTFTIVAVLGPGSVGIVNANAVADMFGMTWSVPTPIPDAQSNLWDSQAHLSAFDEVVLGCTGGTSNTTETGALGNTGYTAQQGYFYNFLMQGGRLFANHYSPSGLFLPASMSGHATAAWVNTATFSTWGSKNLHNGLVAPDGGINTPQRNFKTWLTNQGAYAGPGVATPQAVEQEVLVPSPTQSFEWLRGSVDGGADDWTTFPNGNMNLIYSFDVNDAGLTPTLTTDGGAGTGCGRTVISSMHVDITRGSTSGIFPATCTLGGGLSPNEAAFEYLLFMLSSCAVGGAPIQQSSPTPPPPAPTLGPVTFTRDYQAVCAPGSSPVWQLFEWQATIPSGTNIQFSAQTAPDSSGSPGAFGPAVPIGVATSTTASGTWNTGMYAGSCDGGTSCACTVDDHLRDLAVYGTPARSECPGSTPASQQVSQGWLRVSMTFNPSGSVSPVLQAWTQLYDCVPTQ